ncbi:MAG: hypothetical protein ABJ000_15955 [Saccharospirillum sp.]|uniref:hypothetical protein n=1 Tax=Saccharospirillum sp. TaxID=2033801 RepID=UPI003297E9B1
MTQQLTVLENDTALSFNFDEALNYHGRGFPGGVAHGFKMLEAALPLLNGGRPVERRKLHVLTAFPGPGARDVVELVTRANTEGRYEVDIQAGDQAAVEAARGRYWFRVTYGNTVIELVVQPGIIDPEFIALGRKPDRTPEDERRQEVLKHEMANRIMALPAGQVYLARQVSE